MGKKNFEVAKCLAYIPCLYHYGVINSCIEALSQTNEDGELDPAIEDMRKYLINISKSYPRSLMSITAEYIRLNLGINRILKLLQDETLPRKM